MMCFKHFKFQGDSDTELKSNGSDSGHSDSSHEDVYTDGTNSDAGHQYSDDQSNEVTHNKMIFFFHSFV